MVLLGSDGYEIRAAAVSVGCPVMTTISEFAAAVQKKASMPLREHSWDIMSLQEHGVQLAAAVDARSEGGEA